MQEELLQDYISAHTTPESDYLRQVRRRTNRLTVNPRMCSGHVQGRFLSFISQLVRPRYILELGTFTGYSALCLAEGLQPEGRLITMEKNDELEDLIRENLAGSPFADNIDLRIGTVAQLLGPASAPLLPEGEGFDLVFMDADKREYVENYEAIFPLVRKGGVILADNTLWDGHIIEPEYDHDAQTIGLRRFNDFIQADPRVTNVILPIRDGLTIVRKL